MVVGLPESGKSAITDWIEGESSHYRHRQDPTYRAQTIEVPGMYLENSYMRRIIVMMVQNQARALILALDATTGESLYNPGFSSLFNVPVMGVITKLDAVAEGKQEYAYEKAYEQLAKAGVKDIVTFSTQAGDDNTALRTWIAQQGALSH